MTRTKREKKQEPGHKQLCNLISNRTRVCGGWPGKGWVAALSPPPPRRGHAAASTAPSVRPSARARARARPPCPNKPQALYFCRKHHTRKSKWFVSSIARDIPKGVKLQKIASKVWGRSQKHASSAHLAYDINRVLHRQELVGTVYRARTVHRTMRGRALPAVPVFLPHSRRSLGIPTAAAPKSWPGRTAVAGPEFYAQGCHHT